MKKNCLFIFLMLIPSIGLAQSQWYEDILLFNRSYNTKSSSLARVSVADPNYAFSVQSNIALANFQDGLSISYSNSNPYLFMEDANYNYFGIINTQENRISYGLSHYRFNDIITSSGLTLSLTTAGISYLLLPNFSIGTSLKFYQSVLRLRIFSESSSEISEESILGQTFIIDLNFAYSLDYELTFTEHSNILFGFSYSNLNAANYSLETDLNLGVGEAYEFPIVLTLGAKNKWTFGIENNPPVFRRIILSQYVEYQDIIDFEHLTRLSIASEFSFNDYFMIRWGYFSQSRDDLGFSENRSRFNEFTYGFGTSIPLSDIFKLPYNVSLGFDYTRLQQPIASKSISRELDRFTSFAVSLKVEF